MEKAISLWKRTLTTHPESLQAHQNLVKAYLLTDDEFAALLQLEEILRIDGSNSFARDTLERIEDRNR